MHPRDLIKATFHSVEPLNFIRYYFNTKKTSLNNLFPLITRNKCLKYCIAFLSMMENKKQGKSFRFVSVLSNLSYFYPFACLYNECWSCLNLAFCGSPLKALLLSRQVYLVSYSLYFFFPTHSFTICFKSSVASTYLYLTKKSTRMEEIRWDFSVFSFH